MKDELIRQLGKMGFNHMDSILMHSSLKAINRDAKLVIDSLKSYFNEGMVLMPTHTWKQMNETYTYFDANHQPSCVGILTEIFRKSSDVVRSLHPTHSMAGFGRHAAFYLKDAINDQTPCAPHGAWGRLTEIDAYILLVGCGLERNTFMHAIEEKKNIGNRLTEAPIIFSIQTSNGIVKRPFYKHYHVRFEHLSENYIIIHDALLSLGIMKEATFGDAKVYYMKARDLEAYVFDLLDKNLNYFTDI